MQLFALARSRSFGYPYLLKSGRRYTEELSAESTYTAEELLPAIATAQESLTILLVRKTEYEIQYPYQQEKK